MHAVASCASPHGLTVGLIRRHESLPVHRRPEHSHDRRPPLGPFRRTDSKISKIGSVQRDTETYITRGSNNVILLTRCVPAGLWATLVRMLATPAAKEPSSTAH